MFVSEKLLISKFSFEFGYEYKINESDIFDVLPVYLVYYVLFPLFSTISISKFDLFI